MWCAVAAPTWPSFLQCLATIAAVVLLLLSQPWWALVLLAAGIAVVAMLAGGDQPLWSAAGVGYIGLPSLALVWLHGDSGNGMLAVLFLVVVVAAADIGAFVSGRSIGGPRLWPALSPNKTWAGFVGGVLAAALAAFGFALSIGHLAPLRMVAIAVPLAIIAAAGDLFESAVKRRFGKKDMSGLIPGHGGVLDRVDGLIVASMVAATAALLADAAHPAAAYWAGRRWQGYRDRQCRCERRSPGWRRAAASAVAAGRSAPLRVSMLRRHRARRPRRHRPHRRRAACLSAGRNLQQLRESAGSMR